MTSTLSSQRVFSQPTFSVTAVAIPPAPTGSGVDIFEVVFASPADTPVVAAQSGLYDCIRAVTFNRLVLTLVTAAPSTTTVAVLVDGATIDSGSLSAGQLEATLTVNVPCTIHQNVAVAVTAAGGGTGLTAILRYDSTVV